MSKRILIRSFAACALLTAVLAAQAQQYRWVDEKGRVQYSDTPPPAGTKDVRKKNVPVGPAHSASQAAEPYALQLARKNAPVKLYTSPDCATGCEEARALLNQRGIPFTEISVAEAEQLEELKRVSGRALVPVIMVGSSMLRGFEKDRYHAALEAAGYPRTGTLTPRNQTAPPPKPPTDKPEAPAKPPA
ncbi:MAG: glutaredoxin family protein [Betaproteobacteria bacterium]|nr:glutaredoxin family protein [Betaproteobacteria bacterium]